MKIKLLVFEDAKNKLEAFGRFLELKLKTEMDFELEIIQRIDDSTLEQDLMTNNFDLILIDDDLGNDVWGNQIIDNIIEITDSTPEVQNVSKIYYSAGTSPLELKEKIKHLGGNIACLEYDHLVDHVFKLIQSRHL